MGVYLVIAARNLLQARRRTLLLSLALGLVSLFLVLLMTLSQGMTDTMLRSATLLVSGHVNVAGFYKSKPADSAPLITHTSEIRRIVQESTPDIDFMVDRHRGWANVISETGSLTTGLAGIDIHEEGRLLDSIQLA